jgi:hypothetical protein
MFPDFPRGPPVAFGSRLNEHSDAALLVTLRSYSNYFL